MKRNELLLPTTTWMSSKCIMLSKRHQIQKVTDFDIWKNIK